jgi:hypothetical protein
VGAQLTVWSPRSDDRALFAVAHAQGCLSPKLRRHLTTKHESQSSRPSELPPFSRAKQLPRVSRSQDSKAPQLLDAGQSALQSRSVANIRLCLLLLAVCFFQSARPAAAGKWLWVDGLVHAAPLLIILRAPSHLLSPASVPLCFTTALVHVLERLSRFRRGHLAYHGHPRQAPRLDPVLEHFTTSSSQPTT